MFTRLFNLKLIGAVLVILSSCSGQFTNFIASPYEEHPPVSVNLLSDEEIDYKMTLDTADESNRIPVVFWHGMGDTAYGSINIDRIALQKRFPGIKVFSVQIGDNVIEDQLAGYFVNVNRQVAQVCEELLKDKYILEKKEFNAIGFSQGAQFLRALIQRCPFKEHGIRVKNLISLGGQHQGVYGLPNCKTTASFWSLCEHIRFLLTQGAYQKEIQNHLVQAEYWHDPLNEAEYKEYSVFLADINNEVTLNRTYKDNLLALENFVMVEFLNDEMVKPRESSTFGFYEPGSRDKIIPMEETRLYQEDRLGLKQMNEEGRLKIIRIAGNHLQYNMTWFLNEIASVYLDNGTDFYAVD